ncbi:hypothetical protein Hypma_004507 [Hypsizygus marmoreus]|uniref:Uncharacterized protein n=1 Tax=Hypsizygus marmoreus TaxID=39966 RepID=A0A369JYG3_HYPMA|nr:hypothetical protein Hypma_004507 [Hypsizygus marmoreus]
MGTIDFALDDITLAGVWSREDVQQVGIALGACEPALGVAWDSNAFTDSRVLKKLKRDIRTKEITESIITTRTIWNKLDEEVHAAAGKEEEQKRTTTLIIITRRLVKAGYSHDDVQRLFAKYPLFSFRAPVWIDMKNPVTNIRRNWPALRSKIESYLIPIAEEAAAKERRKVVAVRKVLIQGIYDEFNVTTAFPSSCGILLYDPFFTFINSSISIPHPDPVEIMGQIRQFIDQWPPKTIKGLVDILPAHNAHECCTDFTDLRLKLPSTVFTCTACSYDGCRLVGWGEMISHQLACTSSQPFQCRIDDRGSEAALALLELFHLDPYTTELQNLPGIIHKEFVCSACLDRGESNAGEPLLWRECIQHFIDMDAVPGHLKPTWKR